MKEIKLKESRAHRFFSGKGFYVALAISLTAVGGAAWLGVNSALDKIEVPPPELNQNTQIEEPEEWSMPKQAEIKKDDIKVVESAPPESEAQTNTAVVQGFILPIKGGIINAYSGEKVVKSKTLDEWVMHTGIDIGASIATPVKAMSSGKVTEISNDSLWGTTITVEHPNGITSYYANLKSAVSVKANQTVKMGDVIGTVGESCDIERAEESHLHFGVKKDGAWVDPMSVIK